MHRSEFGEADAVSWVSSSLEQNKVFGLRTDAVRQFLYTLVGKGDVIKVLNRKIGKTLH